MNEIAAGVRTSLQVRFHTPGVLQDQTALWRGRIVHANAGHGFGPNIHWVAHPLRSH